MESRSVPAKEGYWESPPRQVFMKVVMEVKNLHLELSLADNEAQETQKRS